MENEEFYLPKELKHTLIIDVIGGNIYQHQFEKLISWHFDVFGLIEKGLAIDINTLKE